MNIWELRYSTRALGRRIHSLVAMPRVVALVGGGGLVAGAVAAALFLNLQISSQSTRPGPSAAPAGPGSVLAFTYLAGQHTNFCQLQKNMVMSYPDGMRIQGACCNPLDMAKYQHQTHGLRMYVSYADIAPDPYDVSVRLAKRLLTEDSAITLTSAQQGLYVKAISMTVDKGPCCCTCWRWYMIQGLAKSLISERGMSAATVAAIIDLSNGCGGGLDSTAPTHGSSG